MCGRYTITSPPDAVREHFGYAEHPNFPPRYNIAPTQPVPVVRLVDGERHFALVRWGLIPSWARELEDIPLLINARGETAAGKPSFRSAMKRRRCLFPADGFYEWAKTAKGRKQPYCVRLRGGGLFAMAGLWEQWTGPEGEEIESATIMTTAANGLLAPIHDRMPAVLAPEDYDAWLDAEAVSAEDASALLAPAPEQMLEAFPISERVNRVANDDASILEPVGETIAAAQDDPAQGRLV